TRSGSRAVQSATSKREWETARWLFNDSRRKRQRRRGRSCCRERRAARDWVEPAAALQPRVRTLLHRRRAGPVHRLSARAGGVRGVAVSVDSLRPSYHDNFRHGKGSLADTLAALARLRAHRLDFIVQTTVTKGNRAELARLVAWAADEGAVSFNCYFLVATGRGASLPDLSPADYEAVLADLTRWQ